MAQQTNTKEKPANESAGYLYVLAESEGFEPPDLLQSTVFKTAAFDHSASSPLLKVVYQLLFGIAPCGTDDRFYRWAIIYKLEGHANGFRRESVGFT